MTLPCLLTKRFLAAILLPVFFFLFSLQTSFAQEYKQDEVIIKLRPSYSAEERLKFHRDIGGDVVSRVENLTVDILRFPGMEVSRLVERLKLDPRVEYAEPNYKAYALEMTNDPALAANLQWGLLKIGAAGSSESAWNISHGNSNVKVTVLDTGISQNHEDLNGKIAANKNCTDSKTADDLYGHGTHVAGIIAANTNNGLGVAGTGYNISLINAKALGDDGSGYYSWLANCLVWAADNGAKVINMSLGGSSDSQLLRDAINYAASKGVVLVAAAGNSNSSSPSYPAYYSQVLSVAATDSDDNKASFSNYGSWVDVAAPGVGIYSTLPLSANAFKQTSYGYGSGTSMATPFAAGLAGLILSTGNFGNDAVVKLIEENADRINGTGTYWIWGRINAYSSLLSATNGSLSPTLTPVVPTVTPTSIPTSTPIPTSVPTPTPKPIPTATLTPTVTPKPTNTPTPTPQSLKKSKKTPSSKLCARFPYLCNLFSSSIWSGQR